MHVENLLKLRQELNFLCRDRSGNFGLITALLLPLLIGSAGGALDLYMASDKRARMQVALDGAVLVAAKETDPQKQQQAITAFLTGFDQDLGASSETPALSKRMTATPNSDGSLTSTYQRAYQTGFLGLLGIRTIELTVRSTALASGSTPASTAAPCITVLGKQSQAVLVNSGVNVKSTACEIDVASTSNPAFIMNSGSTIDTAKFCVTGTNYIKNGGTLTNLKTACSVSNPYASGFSEPNLPATCTTSGTKDGTSISLDPGLHCDVTFNGSPTITFKPGLHIIKGRMIVNSGSTVIANGVTFYFPDVNSEVRANGALTFTGTAPTSGTYKGLLMFEKTSDSSNNANKQQYIFNGSKGETIEGIIYLPNRDVTYNSTTNQTSKISMVVNSMIMNSSNWKMEPYQGGSSGSSNGTKNVRLLN
ncbi:pilus assembly protein TadG-related protein [Rhizobium oryzicola]|uniref:Pilus assembly protein TadG-related protein n=1 Tax=Rhizobium oryzicola TaxID=1232668 RepID=A0ABT8SV60_9HYPH|nr:pilus assembly protein TadG-related protein [Rhizobium oryzicola]MDO1582034.1 pilus assembly protein TadG-related protein [Rhizobium oryzicola]